MTTASRRIERINEQLRQEISLLIAREIKDPRVGGMISVTEVDTAADLRHAKVFVSILGSEEEVKATFKVLKHAAGFFRHELGDRLTLRRIPELDVRLDESLARGDRIMRLMREIEQVETEQSVASEADSKD